MICKWYLSIKLGCLSSSNERGCSDPSTLIAVKGKGHLYRYYRISDPPVGEVLKRSAINAILIGGGA